ncbi:MAG: HAD family phosphatase [Hellea sp.]|nr:HAD family phosphatase [Hellea sp.]
MPPKGYRPKALLFDLGGVVVHWTGVAEICRLSGLTKDQVLNKFANSKIALAFERGVCTNEAFLHELNAMFRFDYSPRQATELWNSWVGAPYSGVLKALKHLKKDFTVACLSNTNDLHWKHLNAYFNCSQIFEPALASHQLHASKPNRECFLKAIKAVNCMAEDILFFDDSPLNVEAAISLGMQAILIAPEEGVLPTLQKLGLVN